MMASIAPFWDGNETWLVVIGASLFAAFPAVYAVFLGAFYLPVLLMLLGLIFRGVAFEFRYRSVGMRRFWDGGFFFGSLVVAFVQGAAVGAMMRGIPVENGQFAGDTLVWLHPFPGADRRSASCSATRCSAPAGSPSRPRARCATGRMRASPGSSPACSCCSGSPLRSR